MSQWEKLIQAILEKDKSLRFDDLCKALEAVGYTKKQPRGGSSHYVFRKPGCQPITIPKHTPLKRVYIELVSDAVRSSVQTDD